MGRFSSTPGVVPLRQTVEVNGEMCELTTALLDKLDGSEVPIRTVMFQADLPFSPSVASWTSGNRAIDAALTPPDIFLESFTFTQIVPTKARVLRQRKHWPPFALQFGACTVEVVLTYKNAQDGTARLPLTGARLYTDGTFTAKTVSSTFHTQVLLP